MHYSTKPVLSAAPAWSGPLDIPSKKDGSNFLLSTCTCTHSLQKIKLGIALKPELVNEKYKLKGSIVLDVQAFDFRFVTGDEEKVKSLHFFSAFLSQRFVAFYIQRIALGIISVALLSYIVTTTFCLTKIYLTLRPSQQAQEQDQDHQGQRNGEGNQLNKARYREILFTALRVQMTLLACYLPLSLVSGLIATGLQTPAVFFLWALTALIRLLTHSGLYSLKMRDIQQAVKDSFRKYASCLSV